MDQTILAWLTIEVNSSLFSFDGLNRDMFFLYLIVKILIIIRFESIDLPSLKVTMLFEMR